MTIAPGSTLPEASFLEIGEAGPVEISSAELFAGRKVVLFGVPGAFTGTCSTMHVPSFIRTADALAEKGVDEILCVAVNDPFVLQAWSEATGARAAGIRMLADASGAFVRAIGLDFDAPPAGFHGRSRRFSALVDDGRVEILNIEESRTDCELSGGETMLAAL